MRYNLNVFSSIVLLPLTWLMVNPVGLHYIELHDIRLVRHKDNSFLRCEVHSIHTVNRQMHVCFNDC